MAYAALTSLAGVIDHILRHNKKYVSLCGKDQMKSLHEKVSLLQDFLEYVSLKSFSPDIDALESRMRDTAYKMEDIIELVMLSEPAGGRIKSKNRKKNKRKEKTILAILPIPDKFSSYFEDVLVLTEEAMEMKKILDNNVIPPLSNQPTSSREAPGSKCTNVGVDVALNQILERLMKPGSTLRIIPITGMGGIGKTTLARASYEAPQTLSHFDVRFWVTVSQEHNIQDILKGLLPEAKQDNEQLIEHVHKNLKGRRYLIVLDDMWDEKVWDRVRIALPDDNKGSRVILTTRLSGVASYVGSSSPVHEMQFLNEDHSWNLLRERVYGHENRSTEFEGIGLMIARNCKGLPLAVVVIAGLLKFNKNRDYWEQVARNTDGKVTTSNDQLFEILSWSYTRLPPHLKACFLYMGVYKEDYEIPTKELVWLWAAEGFLKPKQCRSMEEVAEECLEQLVERSLVLVTKKWYDGKIKTCSLHDVIRELSIRKAEEEKFHYHFKRYIDESTFMNVIAVQRRVSITNCRIADFPRDTFFATTHSLLDRRSFAAGSMPIVQSLKLLRVLNKAEIKENSEVRILFTQNNLRYLHFAYTDSHNSRPLIPKSISEVQNLETLIVSAGWGTNIVFPSEIWNLQRLRHIVMCQRCDLEFPLPNQSCPSLQTLSGLMNIDFTKRLAERVPNLKILKLEYEGPAGDCFGGEFLVYDQLRFSMDNLQYLHQLEALSLHFKFYYTPTNFVFPQNLKKLSLGGPSIPLTELSRIGSLPNLKVLKLKSVRDRRFVVYKEWEPIEGEFLQLEYLKMKDLEIKHWRAESIHFPCLRKLEILDCDDLEEVPESLGEIDTLETLIVKGSGKAKGSVQKIKENQEDMGNNLLQVIF